MHKLPKLKKYNKKFDYSFAFGVYPVLDLQKYHGDDLLEVIINPKGEKSKGVIKIKEYCDRNDIPYIIDERLIQKLAYKENTYVIGIFKKYKSNLEIDKSHVLLDQPRNMGNIGTIIRTMLGLGFNNLAIIKKISPQFLLRSEFVV